MKADKSNHVRHNCKSNRQSRPSDSGDDLLDMWSIHIVENVNRNVLVVLAASFDVVIIQFQDGYLLFVFAT